MMWKRFSILAVAVAILTGCGSKPAPQNQIHGTVYFHGSPLPGGMVVFIPDADLGGSGNLVMGKIEKTGQFKILSTPEEPFRSGWHRVTVCGEPREEKPSSSVNLFRDVPARYRNPQLSGLKCELKAGANRIDIHLEDY